MKNYVNARRLFVAAMLSNAMLVASPHSMAFAQAPTDEQVAEAKANVEKWNAIKAEKEAQTAAINADKAKSEAEAEKAKAAFGPLGNYEGAEGTTTLGTNAGKLEGQLLSGVASEKAAVQIAGAVAPVTANKAVFVLAGEEAFGFDVLDAYNAKWRAISASMDAARQVCPAAVGALAAALPLPAIGAAIELAAQLFRTDFTVSNLDIATDDLLLARSVAAALASLNRDVVIPSMVTTPAIASDNSVVIDLKSLGQQHDILQGCLSKLNKAPKTNKDAIAKLSAISKRYDDFITGVSAPNEKGAIEIIVAARQAILRDQLDKPGTRVLRVKMHSTGGTLYTQKNFWTAFGAPIFHVTGGTVISYALADPKSGKLSVGGSLMCSSGFHTAKQVHARTTAGMNAKPLCWKINA